MRKGSNYLQGFRKFFTFYKMDNNPVELLERAMGVAQHHDGVSGTERQHVAYDYAKRLAIGIDEALSYFNLNLNNAKYPDIRFSICKFNISECTSVENSSAFVALIFNPLSYQVQRWVRVPVKYNDFEINDIVNQKFLLSETILIDEETMRLPERNSSAIYNIVFKVDLQPLEVLFYEFQRQSSKKKSTEVKKVVEQNSFIIKNQFVQYNFDSNGNLNQLDNIETGVSTSLNQLFCFYKSMTGNNSAPEFQPSGAYIFRPQTDDCSEWNVKNYTIYRGKQFDEVHQIYNDWISQTIRLYNDSRYAEFEWQVGPIDVSDQVGKEIVIKFITDLKSNSTFYTDANGREMLKRVRDYRPTWNLNQTERTAGNYYPVNSRIYIKDEIANKQFTLVTDRSQGGSSIQDGSVEIMLHRRILTDDHLGVSEPLNEPGVDGKGLIVKGKFYVILDKIENSARIHRPLAIQINNDPLAFFSPFGETERIKQNWKNINKLNFNNFPPNLHLLTLMLDYDYERANTLIMRIEHFYEIGEDSKLSLPVIIDLKDFFFNTDYTLLDAEELALGTNMNVENLNERLKWNYHSKKEVNENNFKIKKTSYVFSPMEIKTFRLWIDLDQK